MAFRNWETMVGIGNKLAKNAGMAGYVHTSFPGPQLFVEQEIKD